GEGGGGGGGGEGRGGRRGGGSGGGGAGSGAVPRLCEIYDEPFSDECGIPTYLLCKAARREVKVALSADGGDEFFCGYTHYTMLSPAWERVSSIPLAMRRAGSAVLRAGGVGDGGRLEA